MKIILALFIVLFLNFGNFSVFAGGPSDNYIPNYGPSFTGLEKNYDVFYSKEFKTILDLKFSPVGKSISFSSIDSGKNVSFNFSGSGFIQTKIIKENSENINFPEKIEKGEYDEIINFEYSKDKKHYFYIGKSGDLNFVVKNGKKVSKGYLDIQNLTYSDDLSSFSFSATKGITKNMLNDGGIEGNIIGGQTLVKDNIEIATYPGVGEIKYSPNGKEMSYSAYIKDGEEILVKGKDVIGKYNGIGTFIYQPSGNDYLISTFTKDYNRVLVDKNGNKKSNEYNLIFDDISYFPNGKSFIFSAIKNNKILVVKDGIESQIIENKDYGVSQISQLTLSPDNKSFAFVVELNGKNEVPGNQYIVYYKAKNNYKYGKIDLDIKLKIKSITDRYTSNIEEESKILDKVLNILKTTEKGSLKYEILNEFLNQLKN